MKRTAIIHVFALLAVVAAGVELGAQREQADTTTLKASLERRFELVQLRGDGVIDASRQIAQEHRRPAMSNRLPRTS